MELYYSLDHGFYTSVKTSIALRACPESRKSVSKSYPVSFGSRIHRPNIVFNLSLDTLYFDDYIQPRVTQFLACMPKDEMESLQYIAVDSLIDE